MIQRLEAQTNRSRNKLWEMECVNQKEKKSLHSKYSPKPFKSKIGSFFLPLSSKTNSVSFELEPNTLLETSKPMSWPWYVHFFGWITRELPLSDRSKTVNKEISTSNKNVTILPTVRGFENKIGSIIVERTQKLQVRVEMWRDGIEYPRRCARLSSLLQQKSYVRRSLFRSVVTRQ